MRDVDASARGTRIEAFSHFDSAAIGRNCRIGPYARLRPGTELAEDVHIGNFVEVKASTLGAGSKANHLAYVGDAMLGERVNFGAGSITANYDGANKHRSIIGDDVQSARIACSWRRSPSAPARRSAGAARSSRKRRPGTDASRARSRYRSRAGSGRGKKRDE